MSLHDPRPGWTPERRAHSMATHERKRAERIAQGWIPARADRAQTRRYDLLMARLDELERMVADLPELPELPEPLDADAIRAIVREMLAQQPRVVLLKPDHRRVADGGRTVRAQVRAARQQASA